MAWGSVQLPKSFESTQTSGQEAQSARRSGIGFLLVRC